MEQPIGSVLKKEYGMGCLLPPCLFNVFAEHIKRNARLDELKVESRGAGETSTTSDIQMIPL